VGWCCLSYVPAVVRVKGEVGRNEQGGAGVGSDCCAREEVAVYRSSTSSELTIILSHRHLHFRSPMVHMFEGMTFLE
jgi:hypothetical protein